ncbi:hypothetical protein C8J57DRAFT_1468441 [Mycena rebaudengoi]|nr:hypothetical protein C8J57DRAFT_1468441 [Mycena rebaudengoi]
MVFKCALSPVKLNYVLGLWPIIKKLYILRTSFLVGPVGYLLLCCPAYILNEVKGTPFHVTANGKLLAFGGFATNTNDSLQALKNENATGGLFGLTFAEVCYRQV